MDVVFSTLKAIDSVCDAAIVEDEAVVAQVITVASVRAVIGGSAPALLVVISTFVDSSTFETSCSSVFVPPVVS